MPVAPASSNMAVGPIEIREMAPSRRQPTLAEDVRTGFAERPKSLPPKYFYDSHGSELFDRICDTPEYYQTRTEDMLLREAAAAVLDAQRPDHIVELGSGTSRKTRRLLDACEPLSLAPRYWPFDVCREVVEEAGRELTASYPWLRVTGLVGDYLAGLDGLSLPAGGCLYVFLGGTLGNFTADESVAFLRELRSRMRDGDGLLLGVDRVKDPAVLEAAYDDAQGITAAFNLNVLNVLNRELGAAFPLDQFRHRAAYNAAEQRVEMYLVAQTAMDVPIAELGRSYRFEAGEPILTEISRKFTTESLEAELRGAGLRASRHYEPADAYFSLVLARPD